MIQQDTAADVKGLPQRQTGRDATELHFRLLAFLAASLPLRLLEALDP
jgi:hypothetical protein